MTAQEKKAREIVEIFLTVPDMELDVAKVWGVFYCDGKIDELIKQNPDYEETTY